MRLSIAAIAVLLLASCGGGGQSGNEQANDRGKAADAGGGQGGSITLQPGEWETTLQFVSMNLPQGVDAPMPPPTTMRTCLTAEQASAPNAGFLSGSGPGSNCTSENMSMANGRIQGTVQCSTQGVSTRLTMDGQFTPTSYELTQQVESDVSGATTQSEMRITSRRVGDCPAG